jgi:hypothetical protein
MNRLPPVHAETVTTCGHHFVFLYESGHERETLRTAGRWAADPELPITWGDVTRLAARVWAIRYGEIGTQAGAYPRRGH